MEYDRVIPYKAVVIGLGKIGLQYDLELRRGHPSSHVMAYQMNSCVHCVGAVDTNHRTKELLKRVSPETDFYTDVITAVQKCQPDIVSICSPPQFHLSNIQSVMKAGVPRVVFCEKPLVANIAEALLLKELLAKHTRCLVVPNISRRWINGLRKIMDCVANETYGTLEKIHIRYTRGIYNTGAHLFDLLRMWTGKQIQSVQVLRKVATSSDDEHEPSYVFSFEQEDGVYGYAEVMNDKNYYMFEIDLYFSQGKIEMRNSGDDVLYYGIQEHHLFDGYRELFLQNEEHGIFRESSLANAVENIIRVMQGKEQPYCVLGDAIYPLFVADALERSYRRHTQERVSEL